MSALVKTLNVFPKERSIVARERTRKAYNVLPYLSGVSVICAAVLRHRVAAHAMRFEWAQLLGVGMAPCSYALIA